MNIFQWLKENNYDYTWDVKIGSGIPEIIGFNNEEIVAFEVKQTPEEIKATTRQCLQYLEKVNKVYVILPSKAVEKLSKSSLKEVQKKGIGLIEANEKIKVLITAKKFGLVNERFLKELKEKSLGKLANGKGIEEKIIDLLSKHPEGLTAIDISKLLGMHRHTATKYVNQLVDSGVIHQRKVGPANLCYLKESVEEKKGSSKAVL